MLILIVFWKVRKRKMDCMEEHTDLQQYLPALLPGFIKTHFNM